MILSSTPPWAQSAKYGRRTSQSKKTKNNWDQLLWRKEELGELKTRVRIENNFVKVRLYVK